ncbi:MAG: serine/threonine protein kinase [Thermoguttaceae bacterium]|nr:serine/threonine protein kinase [Thermoguttaceae bacterium]
MSPSQVSYIGPYRLLNIVYTGQTSRTWQAYDDRARRYVGIKTLFQSSSRDRSQVGMLKWEYSVGSKLDHERIVKFYEYGSYEKIPYIVMEWCPAQNIKQWMRKGYEEYCVELPQMLPQMIEALAVLHESGWTHRDVKPDNFLYSAESGVKLIDFALARGIKGNFIAKLLKIKGAIQGTASYMSPEQIMGLQVDGRADIYSLGCAFFEILSNRPTFTGNSMNELLQKHVSGAIPSILARNKNITPEFAAILTQMMAKRPDDRPKEARDILRALRSVNIFKRPPQIGDKTF